MGRPHFWLLHIRGVGVKHKHAFGEKSFKFSIFFLDQVFPIRTIIGKTICLRKQIYLNLQVVSIAMVKDWIVMRTCETSPHPACQVKIWADVGEDMDFPTNQRLSQDVPRWKWGQLSAGHIVPGKDIVGRWNLSLDGGHVWPRSSLDLIGRGWFSPEANLTHNRLVQCWSVEITNN